MGPIAPLSDAQRLSWHEVRDARGAVLLADQPAPAPQGLLAFCVRESERCANDKTGVDFTADAGSHGDSLLVAATWEAPAAQTHQRADGDGQDASELFQRMLAARAQGPAPHYGRHEFTLTEARWQQLTAVNRQVNHAIVPTADMSQYGVSEYWAMPISEGGLARDVGSAPRGDCEDYALEKRARLISLGWRNDALVLAVAHASGAGMHAVLVVQTDHGDFVLDNLGDEPQRPDARNYHWVSRQADGAMTDWASARIQLAPSPSPSDRPSLQAALRGLDLNAAPSHEQRVAVLNSVVDPSS
jgi:predicted transglutaminase-like cysteine proteinase